MKDIFFRWWEQPVSALARVSIGALIGLLALVILMGLLALEKALRERLEKFGTELVIIREPPKTGTAAALIQQLRQPNPIAEELLPLGTVLDLYQAFAVAKMPDRENVPVFFYPQRAAAELTGLLRLREGNLLVCDWLPEGVVVEAEVNGDHLTATAVPMPDLLKPTGIAQMLLVPEQSLAAMDVQGLVPIVVFKKHSSARPLAAIIESLQEYYRIQQVSPVQIQSSLSIVKELERLNERQKQWRLGIAAIFAVVLVPVLAAISLLEFQQHLYIAALLRSMGATAMQIFMRHLLENLLLVNLSILIAVGVVLNFHGPLFANLGFAAAKYSPWDYGALLANELRLICAAANIGAFVSTLPVALALRKPVGKVLL